MERKDHIIWVVLIRSSIVEYKLTDSMQECMFCHIHLPYTQILIVKN